MLRSVPTVMQPLQLERRDKPECVAPNDVLLIGCEDGSISAVAASSLQQMWSYTSSQLRSQSPFSALAGGKVLGHAPLSFKADWCRRSLVASFRGMTSA
jgi:hypothetical protein